MSVTAVPLYYPLIVVRKRGSWPAGAELATLGVTECFRRGSHVWRQITAP